MDLATALHSPDSPASILPASITAVYSDGSVDIDLGGNRPVASAAVLTSYTPSIGDVVEVMRRDSSSWLVLGTVHASSGTTVTVSNSWLLPYNVLPAAPSGGIANPFVVNAVDAASFRTWEKKWETTDIYQASNDSDLGWWRGCYFYGVGAFADIAGTKCTAVTIRLHRDATTGSPTNPWIAPHAHETRPSGSPVFTEDATKLATLNLDTITTYELDVTWGQGLIDGTIKGFGHRKYLTSAYMKMVALAADSASGQLSISWE